MFGDAQNAPWADDQKDFVAARRREGRSASEIAALVKTECGRVCSRNAVIAIINRMNLSCERRVPYSPTAPRREPKPRSTPKERPARAAKPAATPRPAAPPPARPPPAPLIAGPTARGLLDLRAHNCKFTVGEATGWDQLFCGAPAAQGDVYCPGHRAFAGGARIEPKRADREARLHRRHAWL